MSKKDIYVVKRDGRKEKIDYEKINQVLMWSTEMIKNVSASDVAMNAQLQIYDGMTTKEIHEVLIQSAANLITEDNPSYQYVAANLLNFFLRKNVFGASDKLPTLYEVIKKNTEEGIYDSIILEQYTEEDINKIEKFVKHERDYKFTYAGIQQLIDKYLLKDRHTGRIFETPQFMYILISMTLFGSYENKEERLSQVRKFYNDISLFKISLPTPIMCGVRTPLRQYSSCTLIDVGDSIDSLFASNSAVGYYTAKRAGIGLNFGRIRAIGDRIRGGEVIHTGVIPFLKMFESTTRSCTQNGVRGGNSTTHFPYWHKEIQDILVLKNNKGTDDNRVRKMDYSIQMNRLFYRRFVKNEDITLFSPGDVPDLYEAFFRSNDEFEALYEKYEKSTKISKKKVNARDLMNQYCQERIGTGRIYLMNVDHANEHSSFKDTVYQSNLCQEINLPTYPLSHIDDGKVEKMQVVVSKKDWDAFEEVKKKEGLYYYINNKKNNSKLYRFVKDNSSINIENEIMTEEDVELVYGDKPAEIALCVLSAINLGEIKEFSELEGICENIVRSLDFVIEHQDYPVWAAKKMLNRRSIGVGITNLAYFFAKNGVKYGDKDALNLLDELMEHIQYYLIKASVKMAKEYGTCKWFNRTKYSDGILPIDTYCKEVDNIVSRPYTLDWESLRKDVLTYGMRHSTLTAMMPCESSSLVTNSTNGMEPPRTLITAKKSKQGVIKFVVPEAKRLKDKYCMAFDVTNKSYTNTQSVIQKWIDQGISSNHYYDFSKYKDGNIPLSEIVTDLLYYYKMGNKQIYYANSYDNKKDDFSKEIAEVTRKNEPQQVEIMDDAGCESGACSI